MPRQQVILIVAMVVFICSGLAFLGGLGLGFGLKDTLEPATAEPAPTLTASPAAYRPVERPAPAGQLLLDENFSQPVWEQRQDDEHSKRYKNGQYIIAVEATGYSFWSVAGETFADFILEVDTVQRRGPEDNDYGVILRRQDDANFYSFEISGDGYYIFTKLVDDELLEIIPWQESQAIRRGDRTNRLRVEAVGPNFTFYINDELVDSAIDSDFVQGDIGLLVGTYEEAGVEVGFDNLKVWAVEDR
ncbi:MAG: family 16 glycoside hydrolase [Chloroflexota bacterium]